MYCPVSSVQKNSRGNARRREGITSYVIGKKWSKRRIFHSRSQQKKETNRKREGKSAFCNLSFYLFLSLSPFFLSLSLYTSPRTVSIRIHRFKLVTAHPLSPILLASAFFPFLPPPSFPATYSILRTYRVVILYSLFVLAPNFIVFSFSFSFPFCPPPNQPPSLATDHLVREMSASLGSCGVGFAQEI